ncbi:MULTISPECIES: ABC transporter permease [Kitasatospora]|uniref:Putative peptide ABC transporter permease protein n=1 Tax=Kitasatospora setae (strain ATCC 33774 / DSM 43861 / JCM 3304 / KCC A-0304 / NBRC 14216 / KM-6054) TaxID=452652 RepID=E4NJR6_KITSK|nr:MULTISPECIES: ABC transporter permease [Kitasatospora]BAJ33214.1 putative peptide ABC transporter permease protein [Kitasatospora setae KM-6054]
MTLAQPLGGRAAEDDGNDPERGRPRRAALRGRLPLPRSPLVRYLAVRLLLVLPTVLLLLTAVFFLMRATGDPITTAFADRLTPAQLQEKLHAAGYDRPLLTQYFDYLRQTATGDFGRTATDNRAVSEVLRTYGAATLELACWALLVAVAVGVPLGALAARFRDRAPDAVLRLAAVLAYATPVFFVGLLLKLVLAVGLGWLPVSGRASIDVELRLQDLSDPTGLYLLDAVRSGDGPAVADVLRHAVLPALALGLLLAGVLLRLVRTHLISTLEAEYVEAARSRGVGGLRLVTRHAARPALIPVVTVLGLQVAGLLGGAVLTETTFEWKGLGYELAHYLTARDFAAVQGIVALFAVVVAVVNFLVDALAALIDPRVRY